jgi:phosphotransferase system HPr-like phosphotransfer protein
MVIIEMDKADIEYAYKIQEACEQNSGIITQQSFSGISELIHIGIDLTQVALPFIAGIVTEMIRQNKRVRIKVGDIEIDGLSEKNALKKLEQLLERKKNKKSYSRK